MLVKKISALSSVGRADDLYSSCPWFESKRADTFINLLLNFMPENISFNQNSQEKTVEQKKQDVVAVLKKFRDKITGFSYLTFILENKRGHSGGFSTSKEKRDSEWIDPNGMFKDFIDVVSLEEKPILKGTDGEYSKYLFDKKNNKVEFIIPLGRDLTTQREGNLIQILITFKEGDKSDKSELFEKIKELLKTVGYHYYDKSDKVIDDKNRYQIAKENLPVAEAFREINQIDKSGDFDLDMLVEQYKRLIEEYEEKGTYEWRPPSFR